LSRPYWEAVPRRPGFGVPGSPWLGLAGGLGWGLALVRRDRWGGVVGYAAESSASPRRRGPGGSRSKGESNDQVTHPAESTEPTPDAAGSAGRRRSHGGAGGVRFVGLILRRRQRQHQHQQSRRDDRGQQPED